MPRGCFSACRRWRVINLASIGGKGFRGTSNIAYAGSKGAVITMTRIGASQLAPHNINVNTICPGATRSEMYDTIIGQIVERDKITEAEAISRIDASVEYRRRYRKHRGFSGVERITEYHRPIVERRWRVGVGLRPVARGEGRRGLDDRAPEPDRALLGGPSGPATRRGCPSR
jgi:NAD(P)-dependent dehydrogenase (short-subunit alcohol dehydrogenase family)